MMPGSPCALSHHLRTETQRGRDAERERARARERERERGRERKSLVARSVFRPEGSA